MLYLITAVICFAIVAVAFLLGAIYGQHRAWCDSIDLLSNQQKRGDYWFDKYQAEIRDGDWTYIGEWNDREGSDE